MSKKQNKEHENEGSNLLNFLISIIGIEYREESDKELGINRDKELIEKDE